MLRGCMYMYTGNVMSEEYLSRHLYRLDMNLNIRVSDFGLSRVITKGKDYYRAGNNKELPVKWMAPESLTDNVFTTFSDVVRHIGVF